MRKRRLLFLPILSLVLLLCGFTGTGYNPYSGGYYNCTWTAWQLAFEKLGIALPNFGNAGNWYNAAANAGYYVDQYPSANSIAVWSGHVGYVDDYDPATNMIFVEQGGMRISSSGYWAGWMNTGPSLGGQGLIGFIHLDGNGGYQYSGEISEYATEDYSSENIYYQTDDADFPDIVQQEHANEIAVNQRKEAETLIRERPMINTYAISIETDVNAEELNNVKKIEEKQSPRLISEEPALPAGIPSEAVTKIAESTNDTSKKSSSNNNTEQVKPLNLF